MLRTFPNLVKKYIIDGYPNNLYQGNTIKTHEILYIISEISEALSLTTEPNLIVDTVLDSLSRVLQINCSWVQLVNPTSQQLRLVSWRNFTAEIEREIAQMDMRHYFGQEIVGLGNRIIIPNLSRDGSYGMSVFERAGFQSLVAVPIMTYKALGIMGAAYRERKRFSNDFTHMLNVIANLLGMALNKQLLNEHTAVPEDAPKIDNEPVEDDNPEESAQESETAIYEESAPNAIRQSKDKQETFKKHTDKMSAFNKLHKPVSGMYR